MKTSTGTLCAIVAGAVLAWAEPQEKGAPEIPGRDAAEKELTTRQLKAEMEKMTDKQAGSLTYLWTQIRTQAEPRLTTASLSSDRPGLARAIVGQGNVVAYDALPLPERIIGVDNLLPISFLQQALRTQKAVGRVTLRKAYQGGAVGMGIGTGFLVSDTLLITNNHVIPDETAAASMELQFNFQESASGGVGPTDTYPITDLIVTDKALDYTLVRLKPMARMLDGAERVATFAPGVFWGSIPLNDGVLCANGMIVNIIQHPLGGFKRVAIQDNRVELEGVKENFIRYTTDTEPGSSGSPVFNNQWELVALHHSVGERNRDGTWKNNEGVRIDVIVRSLREKLKARQDGEALVKELGL
ncbi:MAG: trypsin-like peptidase domain-containing protein [Phycisphaerales bacterium]|nr:trypsin-like peptidase domain-containing protein [Planctomycetota bacterium]